jgi:nucleoside-triphosphatase
MASPRALLLTGPPGCGKTTVLRRVAEGLAGGRIRGFLTEEIRAKRERQGFRLETFDGQSAVLAHVSNRAGPRVGKYGVNVPALERIVDGALDPGAGADIYLVDEIGRMECLSGKFIAAMTRLLDSGKPVVATVALRGTGFIEDVRRRPDVEVWPVTPGNREELPEKILSRLRG